MKLRKIFAGVVLSTLILSSLACGTKKIKINEDELLVRIENCVNNKVDSIGMSWIVDEKDVSTSVVRAASNETPLERGDYDFSMFKSDIGEYEDNQKITVKVSVTDMSGKHYEIGTFKLKNGFGELNDFDLEYKNGEYKIKQS